MLKVTSDAARHAFKTYVEKYVKREKKAWSIEGKLELYNAAANAFDCDAGRDSFAKLYNELKGSYQVFRNAQKFWDIKTAFSRLCELRRKVPGLGVRRLSQMADSDWRMVWSILQDVRDIKKLKSGDPSLVAISKFLHFWNPRLFVIFDREFVENWAFRHGWLAKEVPLEGETAGHLGVDLAGKPELSKYLRCLIFAGDFVRANQYILSAFDETVREHADKQPIPDDVQTYEATAFEWCILGLVDMSPDGVLT